MLRKVSVIAGLIFAFTTLHAANYVGIGGNGPIDILQPNTVAWRIGEGVFLENMLFEPSISINLSKTSVREPSDSTDYNSFGINLGLLAIRPVKKFDNVQLHTLFGFGLSFNSDKQTSKFDATEGDYTKSSTFGFSLNYGFGMQVGLTKTISVGVDAISGLSFTTSGGETKSGNVTTDLGTTKTLSFGLSNTVFRFMLFFGL